jgi:hypothetical protein
MYAVCMLISAYSFPLSRTSISASAVERSVTRSPSLRSSAPRFDAVSAGHSPEVKARCAARTARSTSSAVPRGMSAHGVARKGSSLSKWSRELASTHCPPMNIWYLARAVAVTVTGILRASHHIDNQKTAQIDEVLHVPFCETERRPE